MDHKTNERRGVPWRHLACRLLLALVLAFFLALVPLPSTVPTWVIAAQWPVTVFLTVALIGKALYDTLFWDRFH